MWLQTGQCQYQSVASSREQTLVPWKICVTSQTYVYFYFINGIDVKAFHVYIYGISVAIGIFLSFQQTWDSSRTIDLLLFCKRLSVYNIIFILKLNWNATQYNIIPVHKYAHYRLKLSQRICQITIFPYVTKGAWIFNLIISRRQLSHLLRNDST